MFGALLRNARHIVRERLDKVLERAEARHPVLRTVSPLRAGSRRGGKRIQGVQGPSKARTRLDSRPAQSWVHALESSASAPVPTASTAGTASTSKPAVDAAPQPERAGAAHEEEAKPRSRKHSSPLSSSRPQGCCTSRACSRSRRGPLISSCKLVMALLRPPPVPYQVCFLLGFLVYYTKSSDGGRRAL